MNLPIAPIGEASRGGDRGREAGSEPPPPPDMETDTLRLALVDSRQRWRELVLLDADLAFETDRRGRFALLAPDIVLGWSAEHLLGEPAEILLAEPGSATFNPFHPMAAARDRRAWLKRADGSLACLSFAVAPMRDPSGRLLGARGVARDVSERDGGDDMLAAAMRRGEVIDQILWRMRQEVMAPRMMQAALQEIAVAVGAEGACMAQQSTGESGAAIRYQVGQMSDDLAALALLALSATDAGAEPTRHRLANGRAALACGCDTRFGQHAALLLWRAPGGRAWDPDDLKLVSSASGIARVILEHESIQHEMAKQARTDPLTGLLNRRAFLEDVARRIDRLDREGVPATLMFVDLDHFKRLNDAMGHDVGDEALCIVAAVLRAAVRPADLVARFGGDEFALWLDGMEELSASERAEMLRVDGPSATAHLTASADDRNPIPPITLSIGIATRWPGRGEDIEALIHRADQIMYEVKRAGRGHWRVSRPDSW